MTTECCSQSGVYSLLLSPKIYQNRAAVQQERKTSCGSRLAPVGFPMPLGLLLFLLCHDCCCPLFLQHQKGVELTVYSAALSLPPCSAVRNSLAKAKKSLDSALAYANEQVKEDSNARATLKEISIKLKPLTDKLGELVEKLPLPRKEDGSIGMLLLWRILSSYYFCVPCFLVRFAWMGTVHFDMCSFWKWFARCISCHSEYTRSKKLAVGLRTG